MKHRTYLGLAMASFACMAQAKQLDSELTGAATPPVIRASEVTNISFTGTVPATFTGALDADDSVFNRPTTCAALSGVGTAVPFDTVNITNNSGNPGNIVITSRLVGGAACTDTNDTFFALYSTFNPATPLSTCLAINDDISGATNRCSSLTFALNAGESRTVVVTGFNNAAVANGLFPYEVTFAGTTGTGGGGSAVLGLSNAGSVNFGSVTVGSNSSTTLTMSNTGTAALNITGLPAPSAPFARTGGTCSATLPVAIAAASSCTVVYSYTPLTAGPSTQTLAVASNGGNATITLTATGIALTAVPSLNTVGLAMLALVLGLFGFTAVRRFR
jgi:Abnormal spindle-like microcephaly-assoc'd, ASPM-SPD-2-Hydin